MRKTNKSLISTLLLLALVACVFTLPILAYNENPSKQTSSREVLPNISSFRIYSPNNSQYYLTINVNSDYVGYNHITTGLKVKAVQGYSAACGFYTGAYDGIWGSNSDQSLRNAQNLLHGIYPAVTSDGVCGPNTWKGFWGYCGVPNLVRHAVYG